MKIIIHLISIKIIKLVLYTKLCNLILKRILIILIRFKNLFDANEKKKISIHLSITILGGWEYSTKTLLVVILRKCGL